MLTFLYIFYAIQISLKINVLFSEKISLLIEEAVFVMTTFK